MPRSSRRPVRALVAWTVLIAICGVTAAIAHDGSDRVSPTRLSAASAGNDAFDVASGRFGGTGTTVAAPGSTAPAPSTTDTSAPPAGPGPSSVEPAVDDPAPVAQDQPPPDTAPPPPPPVQPAAGAYPVVIIGAASLNGEPQAVPVTDDLVIEQLGGSDQRMAMPGGPATIVTTLRWSPTGADLMSLDLSAGGIDKSFQAPTPVPFLPSGAPVGHSWQWQLTSSDGDTTLSVTGSVLGTTTMTVAGQAVGVTLIDNAFTVSGDVSGTGSIGTAVAENLRLPVVQQLRIDATARVFLFSARLVSDTTVAVTQLLPR